jgi:hypothetical protein
MKNIDAYTKRSDPKGLQKIWYVIILSRLYGSNILGMRGGLRKDLAINSVTMHKLMCSPKARSENAKEEDWMANFLVLMSHQKARVSSPSHHWI